VCLNVNTNYCIDTKQQKFNVKNLPKFVEIIKKSKQYESKVVRGAKKINRVVLFSQEDEFDTEGEESSLSELYKELATQHKNLVDFFYVDPTKARKKTKELKISSYPALFVYSNYDQLGMEKENEVVAYNGEYELSQLSEFLEPFLSINKYDHKLAGLPLWRRPSKGTFVNYKNFTNLGWTADEEETNPFTSKNDHRAQVVFFNTDFEGVRESFEEVVDEIHGSVNVIYFDCASQEAQEFVKEKFGLSRFPRVLVYASDSEKNSESALEISAATDSEDIVGIVIETEIKDNIREVSDSVVSSLIMNNAIQMRKITLAYMYDGEEDEVPLAFRSISSAPIFKDKFEFLALKNPSQQTRQQFQVQKLPTIIGGVPPPEGVEQNTQDGQTSIQIMIYQGDLEDYYQLLDYHMSVIMSFFPQDFQNDVNDANRVPKTIVEFQELTANNFDEICESKKGLCVIAFLDSSAHNEHEVEYHKEKLQILEERNKESSSQFKYMWVNGTCHSYLLPEFDLSTMFLPTVIIYSPSSQKYVKMVRPFNKENLEDFEKSFSGSSKL